MGSNASLLDLIAHGGSLRASQDNQQQQAQTQGIQANTDLTNTQIPVQQELAKQEALKTQVAQRQLRDEEIQRQIWADIGKQSTAPQPAQGDPTASAATPVGGAPQITPGGGGAPQIATPSINPNAPAANAPMVPDYLGNPRALATEMARRGASAPAVMDAFKNGIAMNTNITKMNGDQLDNELKALGMVKNTITGYLASPSDQSYADAYDAVNKTDPAVGHTMPKPAQGFAPSQDQLAHVVGLSGALEQMAANAKTKQETATSAATAEEATAKTNEANQATELAKFKFNLMRSATPETLSSSVDAIIDPKKYPTQNADAKASAAMALKTTGDPAKAAEAVQEAAKGIREATTADLKIPGEVKKATAIASATAPIEVGKAVAIAGATIPMHVQEEVDKQVALAKNAPGAFSAIAEPSARHAAETQYDADTKEYIEKAAAAKDVSSLIAAAQGGNKAAPALIPLATIRQFVSRPNVQELRGQGAAGSLMDKIQGFVNGAQDGQPIPPDILVASKQLADLQIQNASRTYDYKINALKQKGASPQRTELPGTIGVKTPDGMTHVFNSEGEAKSFESLVKQHGGTTTR